MNTETPEQQLARIESGFSRNDVIVIETFALLGIPPEEIDPRANVLVFNAWKTKGRRVAKGASSVKITTWIPCEDGNSEPDAEVKSQNV